MSAKAYGWPKATELVGEEAKKKISDAINPRQKERKERLSSVLKAKTKRDADPMATLTSNVAKTEERAQDAELARKEGAATADWNLKRDDGVEIAEALERHIKDYVFTDGDFHRYDARTGVWTSKDARDRLRALVWSMAGTEINGKGLTLTQAKESYALDVLSTKLRDDDFFKVAADGIACPNGFLKVSKAGAELVPHAQEHRARVAYPIEYDAAADLTEWASFVGAYFEGDEDAAKKLGVLQEYLGASFFGFVVRKGYRESVLCNIGEGDNGKSSLFDVCLALFPDGSTCAVQPSKLANEYYVSKLNGKLLNVVDELDSRGFHETEAFKSASTGKTLTGRDPHGKPQDFAPIAGHLYGANKLPATSDQTHGFWRRWIMLRFDHDVRVLGRNGIEQRMIGTQGPAFFRWIVEGAVRLLHRGAYDLPASHFEAMKVWRQQSDPVAEWVADACDMKEDGMLTSDLYPFFARWLRENGYKPVTLRTFGVQLNGLRYGKKGSGSKTRPLVPKAGHRINELVTGQLDGERIRAAMNGHRNRSARPS